MFTDGHYYTGGKYYSTYYNDMPEYFVPIGVEAWTGDCKSPKYRMAYSAPEHVEKALEEVRAWNKKMLKESDDFYLDPWV